VIGAQHAAAQVEGATVTRFGPNQSVQPGNFQPGDFILTHGKAFFSRLIRFGQRLAFRGKDRKYTWWNHAALIVSLNGDLIEALGAGVERTNLSRYVPTEYHLVCLGKLASPHDRDQICAFAEWALGEKYGVVTIMSIALSLLTGCRLKFGFDGQMICSGLVARALERSDAIFDRSPSHIMPADLAKYFSVKPPPKGTPRGIVGGVTERGHG